MVDKETLSSQIREHYIAFYGSFVDFENGVAPLNGLYRRFGQQEALDRFSNLMIPLRQIVDVMQQIKDDPDPDYSYLFPIFKDFNERMSDYDRTLKECASFIDWQNELKIARKSYRSHKKALKHNAQLLYKSLRAYENLGVQP